MATSWPWAAVVVLASLAASPTHAGDMSPTRPTVIVRTYNGFGVPAHDLWTAEATAGHLFEEIGIRVVWLNCGSGGHDVEAMWSRCDVAVTGAEVIVRICASSRGDGREFATMGFALVSSGAGGSAVLATVFADRVLGLARAAGVDPRPLLGLAIGHELGHLLLSTNAHAALGVMRAIWSQAELRRNRPADWRFLDVDARAIKEEVLRRN